MQKSRERNIIAWMGVIILVLILGIMILVMAKMLPEAMSTTEQNARQEYMDSCTEVTRAKLLYHTSTYLYQDVKITGTVVAYGRSKTDSSDVVMEIYPYGAASDDRIYGLFEVSSSTLSGVKQGDEITLYGVYVGEKDYNVSGGYYSLATLINMLGSDSPNIEVKYFTYTSK